jgi:hypothetical protein
VNTTASPISPTTDYDTFLSRKRHSARGDGFDVSDESLPDALFDFQRALVHWALQQGRAAIFADCGLGKSLMQLAWAEQVLRQTNGNVLILTPLAVAHQTVLEGAKFGIECHRWHGGPLRPGITVVNYEQLRHFDPSDFAGIVGDESARLKAFDGVTRAAVTVFMRKLPYRLLCSATPAPNDYIELGTSSEALSYLGHVDMLNRFFKNDRNNSSTGRAYGQKIEWRFKGHAEEPFWRWVCSWARAIRKPSDLGFDDGAFRLPPLVEREHVVTSDSVPEGMLFAIEAISLREQRAERRRTLDERCEQAAALVTHDRPAVVWTHLNDEADLCERLIPGAVQVSGHEPEEAKEEKLLAFTAGEARVMVTKPSVAGHGLNWQHCAHMTFFPSHSFEQFYQGVRRCWRFGQTQPVTVDIVTTEGESRVLANLQRKAVAADQMFSRLVELMNESLTLQRAEGFTQREELPSWL